VTPLGRFGKLTAAAGLLAASACAPHTRYVAPAPQVPAAFRENANWKPAQPRDAAARGHWWELFNDAGLNALETRVTVSNETLKAAEAQYQAARAAVRSARSALGPQIVSDPTIARAQQSANRATASFHDPFSDFLLPVTASYEADVWGRIRAEVDVNRGLAQATAADVEAASLSLHAELASDYFTLRGFDREKIARRSCSTTPRRPTSERWN
jgi:outer membrane protein TolC